MNLAKKGTVVSIKKIAKQTIEAAIKVPKDFKFIAGQYIWLQIPKLNYPDPRGNTRMFSIASSPNIRGELKIFFRLSKSGYKKTFAEMRRGAKVIFSGPYGSMNLPANKFLPVLFVAGGVAISPFLSMIRFSTHARSGHRITLVYINENKEEAAYMDELRLLEKENPDFRLIAEFGRIKRDLLQQFIHSRPICYVTGSQDFVNFTAKILNKAGVSDKDINFEEFYPSDYTNRKLELRLKNAGPNDPFFLAVESTSNHVIITDINGMILYANKRAEQVTGYTLDEMKGNTPRLWGGLMQGEFYKDFWKLKKYEKNSFVGEIRNRRKNQDEYFAFMNTSPILDGDSLIGYISTEEDITNTKEREGDLEDAKKAARNVIEDLFVENQRILKAKAKDDAVFGSLGEGLVAVDNERRVMLINKVALDILGWSRKELIGKVITDLPLENETGVPIPYDDRPTSKAIKTGKISTGTYFISRKDKARFPIAVTTTPIIFAGKRVGLVEIIRDVTREQEIDRAKSEFVSLASHQLRTPITAVRWYSQMLLGGEVGALNQKQTEYLEEIHHGNQRMIELVNALLNVSRIDLGAFPVQGAPINIVTISEDVLKELEIQIKQKEFAIEKNYAKDFPIIESDENFVRIIFQNLLSNAVAYTPPKGRISVGISKKGEGVRIEVSDSGCGIPQNARSKIYTKFFRADNARSIKPDGTGLGLYITKSVVEALGGSINFKSKEGEGTIFTVDLARQVKPKKN